MDIRSLKPEAGSERWALPRRDFLVLGSAAIFGAAASSITATATPLSLIASAEAGAVLSVGFIDRTGPISPESKTPATNPVSADSLRGNAAGFRRSGARVLIHGLTSPEHRTSASVHLSTFAPSAEGPVPFLAWTHGAGRHGVTISSPRAFFVAALDENGTLPIAIERRGAATRWSRLFVSPAADTLPDLATLEQNGHVCRLTSGHQDDAGLRAGTYFIALRHSSSDRQPDWGSIDVDWTSADADVVLHRHGRPVDFEYVTLTVDHPTA
jgi:hypothetical protein